MFILFSPAREPTVIIVASTSYNNKHSSYPNIGRCVDIFALGDSIILTGIYSDTDRYTMSGTSMAAPHVIGVVTFYSQKHAS
ncbi:S8 family serine peptidase [Candidatus Enterovibrio escicola]|uniref:S8 family serine peptidase n=1 Tax=Candidatus Enterovibrio escicola TaxID=1927127 RepID=UPI001680F446|nr:S8 family serine peptidase [Candidatus Enterovibrio escacola]